MRGSKFRLATNLITALLCMNSGHAFDDVIQSANIDVDIKEFEENQARCRDTKNTK